MTPGAIARTASAPVDPLIGTGHGLDHVLIFVKNLTEAAQAFRDQLGFVTRPGSRFPSGLENEVIRLHEREYVEVLGLYNRGTGHPDVKEAEDFLRKGEGAVGFGIRVSSAEATAAFLKERGFRVKGPFPLTTTYPDIPESPPPFWSSLQVETGKKFIDEMLFFSEYLEGAYRAFQALHPQLHAPGAPPPKHRNSAVGSLHPWLAVAHLEEVAAAYEAVGFPRRRRVTVGFPKGEAVEVGIGRNSLVIVGSEDASGPVSEFLRQRESSYGLIGISLGVQSVTTALGAMPPVVAAGLEPAEGLFGRGVWVPPQVAHGVWLELFEPRTPRSTPVC